MASLILDPESLSQLLTTLGPPTFDSATCSVVDGQLVVQVVGLRSGLKVFGRTIGHVDAEVLITGKRLEARKIRLDWELGKVAGIPASVVRMVAHGSLIRPLILKILERVGVADAVELEDNHAIISLDLLPSVKGLASMISCQRFDIPGARSQALSASFSLSATGQPGDEGDSDST